MNNKYNIGDKVNGGTIFRIEHSIYFLNSIANKRNVKISDILPTFNTWNQIDNYWFQKPLYAIYFKKPVAVLSKEEFEKAYPYVSKEPEAFNLAYSQLVEYLNELMLPEESLIPDKEENNETNHSGKQKIQQLFDFDRVNS